MTGADRDREAVADRVERKPQRPDAAPISTEFEAHEGGIDLVPVAPAWGGQ